MLRSRYFVMFTKCEDRSCCSQFRSPLKSRIPTGFLPAPRVYTHDNEGELAIMKPGAVAGSVKYASLSNILSQPVQQDMPFDTFNAKVNIDEMTCPFCDLTLCSPSELQRHRRAMHFRQRAPKREPFKIEDLVDLDDIVELIDYNGDEYLCVMRDNEDVEWRRLAPTHPLIPLFQKERQRLLEGVVSGPMEIPPAELGTFMSSVLRMHK